MWRRTRAAHVRAAPGRTGQRFHDDAHAEGLVGRLEQLAGQVAGRAGYVPGQAHEQFCGRRFAGLFEVAAQELAFGLGDAPGERVAVRGLRRA